MALQRKFSLVVFISWAMLAIFGCAEAKVVSHAQEIQRYSNLALPNTQVRYLRSKTNHVGYKLFINVPAGYYSNKKKYSAVFLLDADYSFPLAKQIVEHLSDRHRIQDVLIVGIAYDGPLAYKTNRTRDYTPTHVDDGGYGPKYQKVSGHAKEFARFIKTELLPYVKSNFRMANNKTLVGHSFGGLFATWLNITEPGLFNHYIVVSPSLWYDDHYVFKIANHNHSTNIPSESKLFFAIGSKEDGGMYRMVTDLKRFLKNHKLRAGEKTKLTIFPQDDHDTVFPSALTQGLLFIYPTEKNESIKHA